MLYVAFSVAGGSQNDLRQISFERGNLVRSEAEPFGPQVLPGGLVGSRYRVKLIGRKE